MKYRQKVLFYYIFVSSVESLFILVNLLPLFCLIFLCVTKVEFQLTWMCTFFQNFKTSLIIQILGTLATLIARVCAQAIMLRT